MKKVRRTLKRKQVCTDEIVTIVLLKHTHINFESSKNPREGLKLYLLSIKVTKSTS